MGHRRGDGLIAAVVVLTGGIGTGKSTVARLLAGLGAEVVETDRLGHQVLEPTGAAFGRVAARWPEAVVDGHIDRRALGRIVFGDPDELTALEEITHPEIRRLVTDRIDRSEADVVVVEIPIPAGWLHPAWVRLVVDADDETRRVRLRARGMDADEIDARLASQPSREEWRSLADLLIPNEGDLESLESEVGATWEALSERWRNAAPND